MQPGCVWPPSGVRLRDRLQRCQSCPTEGAFCRENGYEILVYPTVGLPIGNSDCRAERLATRRQAKHLTLGCRKGEAG